MQDFPKKYAWPPNQGAQEELFCVKVLMRLHASNNLCLMNKIPVFGYGPIQSMEATHPCLPNTMAVTENQFPKPVLKEYLEQGKPIDMCSSMDILRPSSV